MDTAPGTRTDDLTWSVVTDPWSTGAPPARRPNASGPGPVLIGSAVIGAVGVAGGSWSDGALLAALVAVALSGSLIHVHRRPVPGLLITGAVTVGAMLWSSGSIGTAAGVVLVTGVVAAHVALTSDPFPPAGRPVSSNPSMIALGLLVGSQILWLRTEDPLVAGLMVVAVGLVWVEHLEPNVRTISERVLRKGISRIVTFVGDTFVLMVALVFLYPFGLAAELLGAPRRRRRFREQRSSWCRPTPPSTAGRPYLGTPHRAVVARHLALLAGLAGLATLLWAPWAEPATSPDPGSERPVTIFDAERAVRFSELPAYRGVPFADQLKTEQDAIAGALVPDDVTGFRTPDVDGRYTHVADGERRSLEPPLCACEPMTVWMFGGSAAFGLGQRDEHTVASELVRIAEVDGVSLEIRNFGVPGWTRVQEVSELERRLASEPEPPDIVLFYDGFNDVLGAIISAAVHGIRPDEPSLMDTDDIITFTQQGLDPASVATPEQMADVIAQRIATQRQRVASMTAGTDLRVVEIFQPDAFASDLQFAAVEQLYPMLDDSARRYAAKSLAAAALALQPGQADLRELFDDERSPVFSNLVHTNEHGARVTAAAVWPLLVPGSAGG